ncbi:hypothetical protein CICLE_v10029779mg [Citrus x clementina]|uniref:Secreted protein n=1 Tax=Citrus clementina TaxID=85681 RepID=V4SHE9_CITCL|nr:hypothetical protein CICLE_v10029779mg [Citrus x clementina]
MASGKFILAFYSMRWIGLASTCSCMSVGLGYHFTPTSPVTQPTLVTSGPNSKRACGHVLCHVET